jgi:hypothetical protein
MREKDLIVEVEDAYIAGIQTNKAAALAGAGWTGL